MSGALKCVPIPEARRLANEHGATRFMIIAIDDDGHFAYTTFGRTKAQCAALKEWAEAHAVGIGIAMDQATRPDLRRGHFEVTHD